MYTRVARAWCWQVRAAGLCGPEGLGAAGPEGLGAARNSEGRSS